MNMKDHQTMSDKEYKDKLGSDFTEKDWNDFIEDNSRNRNKIKYCNNHKDHKWILVDVSSCLGDIPDKAVFRCLNCKCRKTEFAQPERFEKEENEI